MRVAIRIAVAASVCSLVAVASAADWPQFRGPGAAGTSSESKLPTEWGPEKNVAWKIQVPGVAWSQPIVWGERIFLTTAITENQQKPRPFGGSGGGPGGAGGFGGRPGGPRPEGGARPEGSPQESGRGSREGNDPPRRTEGQPRPGGPGGFGGGGFGGRGFGGRGASPPDAVYQWKVLCLDRATGNILWEQLAKEGKPAIATHRTNTYASETPVTDGQHVYAYFGMTGLYCYDLSGELVWSKDIASYPMMMGWGTGSSPVLVGERLILQCDNEEKSSLVAFDKRSGGELWRVERKEKSNWSTPYLWENEKRTELVTSGSTVQSYDPATGKLLWELAGNPGGARSTPAGDAKLLYVGTGGGMGGSGPLTAVKAGATGDITLERGETSSEHIAWSAPRSGPPMASPLIHDGCVYVLENRGGIVACYDAKTGKQHYKERLPDAKSFTSSPWAYDGKVFCLDEDGRTFVIQAGSELKVLGANKLDEMFWSSPAIAHGQLLLRGVDHLYCIAGD